LIRRYFFDTSALVKLYHEEKGTETLEHLISPHDIRIVISDICPIELTSALATKVRTGVIDHGIFETVLECFRGDLGGYEIIEVDQAIKTEAARLLKTIAIAKRLRTLDALQLASALAAAVDSPLDLFVAADIFLLEAAQEQMLQTFLA
jgi:predicted nucleic acid-binding protein